MSVAMNSLRVLALSLIATGCAATVAPGPTSPSTLEPVEAEAVDLEAGELPDSVQGFAFALRPPLSGAAVASVNQETAAAPPPPPPAKSPHSFSGGVGIRFRDGESALDILAQYQYHVNPKLDIGAIADWAMSPIDTFLIAPAAWWHPSQRLTLFGAPGVEFASGDGGKAALRLGGSYTLMLGKLFIRPFGWYDFVSDRQDSLAFGIGFGI